MAALPTGTITFLFTDIEGSTTRWEQQRAAMQAAVVRHDAILRHTIDAYGGSVFKTVGDAFYAAFSRPTDALHAALAAQRLLQAEPWSEALGPVRVRMALHTGVADERDGDYFGPPLNRVARLLSAGHGGQVLVSTVTQELVRDHLPDGAALRNLGEHALKDLLRREQIFQLVAPDRSDSFPPLRTLAGRPNNLPLQGTPFIGRERDVALVRARLQQSDARLLTLTGPGGTGKTRLALQVAADLLDGFPDGVWFVNLAPVGDAQLVTSSIAAPLGVPEVAGQPLLDTLTQFLRSRHLLLLLDNFEQVVPAAPVIATMLASAPQLKVLVTSRAPLGIYGEHVFAVPPLQLPDPAHLPPLERLSQYDAVRLFVERAQAAKVGWAITNDNAPAVAEICVRLDGLPLAIELAAARVRLLPPQALLQRLGNRLQLLTGGGRDLPARQQTLRGTIAWSYDLLDAVEQRLFARLAVFVGGRTLEAVEAVCNAEGDLGVDAFDGIASLVDKSLLQQTEGPEDEPRFVMLETIHAYAREQLEASAELEAVRRWHASYFLQLAEAAEPELLGPRRWAWEKRLELEHNNLRAALQWAVEHDTTGVAVRAFRGLRLVWSAREGRPWIEAALAASTTAPDDVRAWAFNQAGVYAGLLGDVEQGRAYQQQALARFRALGDRRGIAFTLHWLGNLASYQGDFGEALALYEEDLALHRELSDMLGVAGALFRKGEVVHQQGDVEAARACYQQSLAISREIGAVGMYGAVLFHLGWVAYDQGNYAAARDYIEQSLVQGREQTAQRRNLQALCLLGDVSRAEGDDLTARRLYEENLAFSREWGATGSIGFALRRLGNLELDQGDYQAARVHLEEGITLCRREGDRLGIVWCLEGLAGVAAALDSPARALRLASAAAAIREAIGAPMLPREQSILERRLASALQALGAETGTAAWTAGRAMSLEQAVDHALEMGDPAS